MKHIVFILAFFLSVPLFADHILGGYMTYSSGIGSGDWNIGLTLYKDCYSGADLDNPAYIGIYKRVGTDWEFVDKKTVGQSDFKYIDLTVMPCLPDVITCLQKGEYSLDINLPDDNFDYLITYQRCCFAPFSTNLISSENYGISCYVVLTKEAQQLKNSAPVRVTEAVIGACLDTTSVLDLSFEELDGDSLVYSFCSIESGGGRNFIQPDSCVSPRPNPPCPLPYTFISLDTGYTVAMPFGDLNPTFFDAETGFCIINVTESGRYIYGVCVSEYRNGVKLSETKLFTTLYLGPQVIATDNIVRGKFSIFPNPTQDFLTLKSLETVEEERGNLVFHNQLGQRIDVGEIQLSTGTKVDLKDLPQGVYQGFIEIGNIRYALGKVVKL